MKSRKVKAYQAHKRVKAKADLTLDESDSDVNPDSFLHDDIEDFNDEKDNELSTDDELIQHKDDSSDEEEILPITDDEKEESDEEDLEEDENDNEEQDLPNREAWGKKKSAYYSADFVDEDRGRTYREDDAEAARAEAEEAFAIQKSVYSNIKADNLGANLLLEGSEESSGEDEKIDITSATKQEKMKYLKTETRILEVCKEFKSSIQEYKKFETLSHLVEKKCIRSKNLENYIRTKSGVLSLYCLNLSLYMMLTSSGKNPKYHPVMQRISSFKELLEELKSTDTVVAQTLDKILVKVKHGEEVDLCSESEMEDTEVKNSAPESLPIETTLLQKEDMKIKKIKTKHIETENEKEVMALIKEVREEMRKRKREDTDEDDVHNNEEHAAGQDENADEKRTITYQIAKNKGLVPHRKKEYRNPRVRHRMKYRKANIRRKGQVRGVVKEIKRYAGEKSGINVNVVKSVKFK